MFEERENNHVGKRQRQQEKKSQFKGRKKNGDLLDRKIKI
jgi:hypothetical protein